MTTNGTSGLLAPSVGLTPEEEIKYATAMLLGYAYSPTLNAFRLIAKGYEDRALKKFVWVDADTMQHIDNEEWNERYDAAAESPRKRYPLTLP